MVDGQRNSKVAFVIQARFKSTRLPGKVLLPLPFIDGKPLLLRITDQLKNSKFEHDIIIATSINTENNVIYNFCLENNIKCFRGDEENVLSRFVSIAQENEHDCIIRLTGDNPLLDIKLLDEAIEYHLINNNDYTNTVDLPIGMNFEIISPIALIHSKKIKTSKEENEHVTLFIKNTFIFKKSTFISNKISDNFKKIRLTIDHASDYALMSLIFSLLESSNCDSNIDFIKKILNDNSWLFDVNSNNYQIKTFKNLDEEIFEACIFLDKNGFKNITEIIKNKNDKN